MIDPQFYALKGQLTLAELVEGLDVELEPHFHDEIINSPSELSSAQIGQLSFFKDKRRKTDLPSCKATACFTTAALAPYLSEQRIIPIVSATPRAHFSRACEKLVTTVSNMVAQNISQSAKIHETAIINPGATVGNNVRIGAYSVIGQGVIIGNDTIIENQVSISFAKLGRNCRIKSGAVIGGAGFGVAKDELGFVEISHFGRVLIGDRVSIGSQTCVDRGQLGDTQIHDDVKIDNLVQIAHNVIIGSGSMLAAHTGISGSCIIGKNVQMGGNVGLADHLTIGDNVGIAARAGVMHDIPSGEVWSGIPAMPIREHMRLINATRKLVKKPKRGNKNA